MKETSDYELLRRFEMLCYSLKRGKTLDTQTIKRISNLRTIIETRMCKSPYSIEKKDYAMKHIPTGKMYFASCDCFDDMLNVINTLEDPQVSNYDCYEMILENSMDI